MTKTYKKKLQDAIRGKEYICIQEIDYTINSKSVGSSNKHKYEVYCSACGDAVNTNREGKESSAVHDHIKSDRHKNNVIKANSTGSIQPNLLSPAKDQDMTYRVTEAFIKADIPLNKLDHPAFNSFLSFISKYKIPSRTSCRRKVDTIYEDHLNQIRADLKNMDIFVMIDESTDCRQNKAVNIIAGALNGHCYKPYLIKTEFLNYLNKDTIGQLLNQSLMELFPGDNFYSRIKFVITDAAPYMKAAISMLTSTFYKETIHITCIAHMIHRVSEKIKENNKTLNDFISNMKSLLNKCPAKQHAFLEKTNFKSLPPLCIQTRWSSWIKVAIYYYDNFELIENFIKTEIKEKRNKGKNCCQSLLNLKIIIEDNVNMRNGLKNELKIVEKFREFPEIITKLESRNLTLDSQLDLLNRVSVIVKQYEVAECKWNSVLEKNMGLNILREKLDDSIAFSLKLKFLPLTSCDVERSFSQYKAFLRMNRMRFTEENLVKHFLIMFNNFVD